ncbi:MAG: hypothetical protein IJR36_06945, partial [Lachnospiraceae bacterium]|nr:hypothetical protein [Lachnospiraceae bacterium]
MGDGLYPEMKAALHLICEDISLRIRARSLALEPIRYSQRTDGLSKKTRTIGIESVMQQLMEHVAVGCMKELWQAKYEFHQYASIKGKGQLRGAKAIQKWTKKGKTKHFVKLDVRQCFRSLSRETAMRWLRRDIGKNALLLWFVDALLQMHSDGLVIGSLLSQFLCNYFMSYGYRYVMSLCKERRGKRMKLVSCALFYMDDILLTGVDRRNLVMAVRKLAKYMKANFGLEIKENWNVRDHDHCGIDMMGFVITAKGKIKIRPRVFIRARRAFFRSAAGDDRQKIQYRVSAYYGFFKAAGIRTLRKPKEKGQGKSAAISIRAIQTKASILISQKARRDLLCAA